MIDRRRAASPAMRRLLIFAGVSIALHLLLAGTALVLPGLLSSRGLAPEKPDAPLPSIEFVMVQKEGFGKPAAPDAPPPPTTPPPQTPPAQPAAKPEPARPTPPPPPPEEPTAEAAPTPPPAPAPAPPPPAPPPKAEAKPSKPQATPPAPQENPAPEINLGGTDSLSSLIAKGEQLIPVGIDTKFRNREPVYPREAARWGQHGTVIVRAHVTPDGRAEAVDIQKSSGYTLLDDAARDAVITWHFRAAIENGVPVRSTISIAIDFALR